MFRRELWSAVKNLPVRVPWLTKTVLNAILSYGLVSRGKGSRKGHFRENADVFFDKPGQVSYGYVMKPLLFPSKTSHTRLFPKKHSFTYSYLLVGIPVGWRVVADLGFISNSLLEDKLIRRGNPGFPHAYLVTAPRFLGYSSNPVSFWYLYNDYMELQAMILEVNNTFDERRMYFLKDSFAPTDSDDSWTLVENPRSRFRQTWPKDFHGLLSIPERVRMRSVLRNRSPLFSTALAK
ncbi:MAG: hypothetical protein Q9171_004244 [Xanthocarpia ochracea]